MFSVRSVTVRPVIALPASAERLLLTDVLDVDGVSDLLRVQLNFVVAASFALSEFVSDLRKGIVVKKLTRYTEKHTMYPITAPPARTARVEAMQRPEICDWHGISAENRDYGNGNRELGMKREREREE